MQFDEAMKIIAMACAAFQGNLQDHQTIQKALAVVGEAGKPVEKTEEKVVSG